MLMELQALKHHLSTTLDKLQKPVDRKENNIADPLIDEVKKELQTMSALLEFEAEGGTSEKSIKEIKTKLDIECRIRTELEEKNKILEEKINNLQKQFETEVKSNKTLEKQIGELSLSKTPIINVLSSGDPKALERLEQLIIEDSKSRKVLETKLEEITKSQSQKSTTELYEALNKEIRDRKALEIKLDEATKHSKVIESQLQEEIKARKNLEMQINTLLKPAVKGTAKAPTPAIQKNKIYTPTEALELLETIHLPKEESNIKKKTDPKQT